MVSIVSGSHDGVLLHIWHPYGPSGRNQDRRRRSVAASLIQGVRSIWWVESPAVDQCWCPEKKAHGEMLTAIVGRLVCDSCGVDDRSQGGERKLTRLSRLRGAVGPRQAHVMEVKAESSRNDPSLLPLCLSPDTLG